MPRKFVNLQFPIICHHIALPVGGFSVYHLYIFFWAFFFSFLNTWVKLLHRYWDRRNGMMLRWSCLHVASLNANGNDERIVSLMFRNEIERWFSFSLFYQCLCLQSETTLIIKRNVFPSRKMNHFSANVLRFACFEGKSYSSRSRLYPINVLEIWTCSHK